MMKPSKRVFKHIAWDCVTKIYQENEEVVIEFISGDAPVRFKSNAEEAQEYCDWYLKDLERRRGHR